MSAVSAISGMNILLFELNRTVRKDKCGRPNYRPAAATRSGGGRKHRAPVKLIGELDQRFFDIAETRVRLRKCGGAFSLAPFHICAGDGMGRCCASPRIAGIARRSSLATDRAAYERLSSNRSRSLHTSEPLPSGMHARSEIPRRSHSRMNRIESSRV